MSEVPTVKVLSGIRPLNSGSGEDTLTYEDRFDTLEDYRKTSAAREHEAWSSEPGSLEELSSARQLASEYFLRISDKVVGAVDPGQHDLWADRFTAASTELNGVPDQSEVISLLGAELESLKTLSGDPNISHEHVDLLVETYSKVLPEGSGISEQANDTAEREKTAIAEYGAAVREKYGPLFEIVTSSGKTEFNPAEIHEVLSQALVWLTENDDPEWSTWKAELTNAAALSVDTPKKIILVGGRRVSASAESLVGLVGHELLVHALRGKNGYKTSDKKLATGLPGYLDTEEGLGILTEYALTGELPDKAYDRYVDIALALGTVDGKQRNRHDLFKISFARQLIRKQKAGPVDQESIKSLESTVWAHVDRIYRGGKGDASSAKQAIYSKDIAYYVGYKQIANFLTKEMESGKTPAAIFDYLSQGKFDPTNPQHTNRLRQANSH